MWLSLGSATICIEQPTKVPCGRIYKAGGGAIGRAPLGGCGRECVGLLSELLLPTLKP